MDATQPVEMPPELEAVWGKPQPLHPQLKKHLVAGSSGFPMIHHPLVVMAIAAPQFYAQANELFLHKQRELRLAFNSQDWVKYVWIHERPYRVSALWAIKNRMADATYWSLVGHVYVDSENLHEMWYRMRKMLRSNRPHRTHIMTMEERQGLEKLPQRLKLWRGFGQEEPFDKPSDWSWSRDPKVAEFFRKRWGQPGRMAVGVCDKKDAVAYFTRRHESEILVPPDKVEWMEAT